MAAAELDAAVLLNVGLSFLFFISSNLFSCLSKRLEVISKFLFILSRSNIQYSSAIMGLQCP